MYISGDNITTYRARIKPNFKPKTSLALKWKLATDGNYYATDRGSSSDVYEASFSLYAKQDEIEDFITANYNNRDYDTNYFTMSGFESTEHIFGEDVDHSGSIDVTVLNISPMRQGSFKGYGCTVDVCALSPTFTGSATLPALECLEFGWIATIENTNVKYDTYNGTYSYLDQEYDHGLFQGIFKFSVSAMRNMRRYIATQRGSTVSITDIYGIDNIFGPYRTNTFPLNVKILDWEDLGMWGVNDWRMKLTLAEQI